MSEQNTPKTIPKYVLEESVLPPDQMTPAEVEVRLAIAGFLIPRLAGTPAGHEVFDALVDRFLNRYPHHKLLAHLLTAPEHLEHNHDAES
ncbi:hypothetical protein [Pseudomonas aeruginosa]|uniref:hypothetical protein n=1 Tax=Pseudomonas aeruginosa TaxID=287 RepID=UPI0021E10BBC|nr:hypothetical protein [Pseudomonas aeruginosa]